jgi:hypothetical protein
MLFNIETERKWALGTNVTIYCHRVMRKKYVPVINFAATAFTLHRFPPSRGLLFLLSRRITALIRSGHIDSATLFREYQFKAGRLAGKVWLPTAVLF